MPILTERSFASLSSDRCVHETGTQIPTPKPILANPSARTVKPHVITQDKEPITIINRPIL